MVEKKKEKKKEEKFIVMLVLWVIFFPPFQIPLQQKMYWFIWKHTVAVLRTVRYKMLLQQTEMWEY